MDGNRKIAVELEDGIIVESVFYGSGTLCLSSQAGCPLGCAFCASGRTFFRNLSLEELWAQVERAKALGCDFRRLTLSGSGEPLLNWDVTRAFLAECRERGLELSLTTTGRPLERLEELLRLSHNGLMLSLHAGTAATYRRVLPEGPGFEALWAALGRIWPELSRRSRRRVGINYLLFSGLNDTDAELEELARRMASFPEATLHLLRYNPVGLASFASPGEERRQEIYRALRAQLPHVRRGNRWRGQCEGGCGTLLAAKSR